MPFMTDDATHGMDSDQLGDAVAVLAAFWAPSR
jgi:hypothetical protein